MSKKDLKIENNPGTDNIYLQESSKKGLGLKEDLFDQSIEITTSTEQVKNYRVEKGETLKSIAEKIMGTSEKWIMLHRANIENVRLTHSGLGVAVSDSGTHYWTHLFLEKN